MLSRTSLPWCLGVGLLAFACANEPPTTGSDTERSKPLALVTVDRSDPATADAQGNASAVARFLSVPAFSDPSRTLSAAGAVLDLPAPDTCQGSDSQDGIEPAQATVELLEAGDVTLAAPGSSTPLVPHAFPTVGGFASGVLYTTRDRASDALPSDSPYTVSTTGSASVPPIRAIAEAPRVPSGIEVDRVALGDVTEVHTGRTVELRWAPGDDTDVVYAELLAYDGSPSVVCTFRDEAGTGAVPAEAFTGTGTGRLALHRLRTRHIDGGAAPSSEMRFDFQVGTSVDFVK